MSLTINTFSDLLQILETHPEWRRKLIKALFPEIDVPKAFQGLAESQQRLEALMERVTALYERLDTRSLRLGTDVAELKTDVAGVKADTAGKKPYPHPINTMRERPKASL